MVSRRPAADGVVERQPTSVGVDGLPGEIRGVVRGEEHGHGRHLFRIADPPERRPREDGAPRGLVVHHRLENVGEDRARPDGVHPDVVGRECHRHGPGELRDPALRDRVGELVRDGHHRVGGRHVDDRSLRSPPHHLPGGQAAEEKRPAEVHGQDPVEVLDRDVEDRARRDDPRVVEEDVQGAEALQARVQDRSTVSLGAHVRVHRQRRDARLCRDRFGRPGALVGQDVRQHHVGAVTGEGPRAGGPDPSCRPGYYGGPPGERDHSP